MLFTSLASLVGLLVTLAVASADATPAAPFWVVQHGHPLLTTRLDPLISPGGVSSHVHSIMGANSFAPIYDYNNSRSATCTTADISADKSHYWTPTLYRKSADGVKLVDLQYVNTYYEMRRTGEEPVYEFPPGFRMLAGSPYRTTYNDTDLTNTAIRYACLNFAADPTAETPAFPETNCPDGLRAEVYFPHCWDGVNAWLEGSAHTSYGSTGSYDGGGACPSTHPKRIMGLFYEFIWDDSSAYEAGARVWAHGDDVGYGLHGDFTNGWPEGLFQEIFDYGNTCAVEFDLASCPPLAATYKQNGGGSCSPSGVMIDEDVGAEGNVLAKLPGNNPFFGGSTARSNDTSYVETAKFTKAGPASTSSSLLTSTRSHADPAVPLDWDKLGCIAEGTTGRALASATTTSTTSMTPSFCISFCASKGYSLAGIEYAQECYCGNALSNGASETFVTSNCSAQCSGEASTNGFCGGNGALTLYKFTGSGTPSAQNATVEVVDPSPTTINSVVATDIRMDTVSGDAPWTGATGPAETAAATATSSMTVSTSAISGSGSSLGSSSVAASTQTTTMGAPTTSLPISINTGSGSSIGTSASDASITSASMSELVSASADAPNASFSPVTTSVGGDVLAVAPTGSTSSSSETAASCQRSTKRRRSRDSRGNH
ncbi:hypothetical protein P7C73_g1402, partial [Tremellales sp. Uapishka_1]